MRKIAVRRVPMNFHSFVVLFLERVYGLLKIPNISLQLGG